MTEIAKTKMMPIGEMFTDNWCFNANDKSDSVCLSNNDRTARFHWYKWGWESAGVRGTRNLSNGIYFWELHVAEIFGSSIMFGIGSRNASLEIEFFVENLLGCDSNSWGLNHKGQICHNGISEQFCKPFDESKSAKVGMLFNALDGSLAYFLDENFLGVAFRNINTKKRGELFPMICSPCYKSEMTLCTTKRSLGTLEGRCRSIILQRVKSRKDLEILQLPQVIKKDLANSFD